MFKERLCGTCVYWDIRNVDSDLKPCRVLPPVLQGTRLGVWPDTFRDDFCGRWKERPAPKVLDRRFGGDRAEKTRMAIEGALVGKDGLTVKEISEATSMSEDSVARHLKTMVVVEHDSGWPARWRLKEQADNVTPETFEKLKGKVGGATLDEGLTYES